MNSKKFKRAEANFLARYPEGFADPAMTAIKKKHKIDTLAEFAQAHFQKHHFDRPGQLCDTSVKIISRASITPKFEKPKFRDFVLSLNHHEKDELALAFKKRLYGRTKHAGFEDIPGMLAAQKIAKWPIISAIPFYFSPEKETFVKPTTAKGMPMKTGHSREAIASYGTTHAKIQLLCVQNHLFAACTFLVCTLNCCKLISTTA